MSRYVAYNPEQVWLLPPNMREELGEDHLAVFVHELVEKLDLSRFETASEQGRPGYPPQLLLKVWLYAYAQGITSSRRIEQRIQEDLGFRFLTAGWKPDFWTLNQFRKQHPRALNDVFTQVVEAARGNGPGPARESRDRFDARASECVAGPKFQRGTATSGTGAYSAAYPAVAEAV
jgi:transposase